MTNAIIIAIISSSALTALITNIFTLIEARRGTDKGVHEGVRLLLYGEIKKLAKQYITAGEIAADELEDLTNMWQCYHGPLGGNGYLDELMGRVGKLPIK